MVQSRATVYQWLQMAISVQSKFGWLYRTLLQYWLTHPFNMYITQAATSQRGADVVCYQRRYSWPSHRLLSPVGITTLLISTALSMWGFIIHGHLCGLFFKRGEGHVWPIVWCLDAIKHRKCTTIHALECESF